MLSPVQLTYYLLISFIRTVKWVELQFLKLFSSWIIQTSIKICEGLGVVFHFEDDSYPSNWGPVQEDIALKKCKKYNSLIHLRIHDKRIFVEAANTCTWGIGEGFVSRKWDVFNKDNDVAKFTERFLENDLLQLYYNPWNRLWHYLEFGLFNLQTRSRSVEVVEKHYDLGNDLYEAFLDPYMQYSCGYWANSADNLDEAQLNKLELIAQKLKLEPGMRVLDIGCGWGMLCKYLAERHGVHCVGVTISEEQAQYARNKCEGLPVEIRIQDYRDVREEFDRIVSVGMIEHVGVKNYPEFFKIVHRNLKEGGIFLLHTIGVNRKAFYGNKGDRWICSNIFPNGCLPRPQDLIKASEALMIMEDWQNFGFDYSKTLLSWREKFVRNWPGPLEETYGEVFYRMWIYYLATSEGVFASKWEQLWQIVFSKNGLENYKAAR